MLYIWIIGYTLLPSVMNYLEFKKIILMIICSGISYFIKKIPILKQIL